MARFLPLLTLAAVALAACLLQVNATKDPKTVCMYESWVHGHVGDGKMVPSDIDTKLCTHIVYAYMGIDASAHTLKIPDPWLMENQHDIDNFAKAKGTAKALVAVGGFTLSRDFSTAAASDSSRTTFVNSVIQFIAKYNFDGVLIEWSNMEERDGANLVALLDKFDDKLASTPYMLAITLPVQEASLGFYNVPKIASYVDFMQVIAFDYAGPWGKTVGHATPFSSQLKTIAAYHKRGAPRSKLVMAVPAYGHTWVLANSAKSDVGADATGPGAQGPFSQTPGKLGYNELCSLIKGNPSAFSIVRDNAETVVHAVYMHGSSAEWITYEDSKTLATKAANLTTQGYGGMSLYTLSEEDSHGICGPKKYPLLSAISEHYNRSPVAEQPVVTIPTPHQTTSAPVTWAGPHCTKVGAFHDHTYCYKYYVCEQGDLGFEMSIKNCDRHQAFDDVTQKCVDPKLVPGCA